VVLLQVLVLKWDVSVVHRHCQLSLAQQPLLRQIVVDPVLRLLKVIDDVIAVEVVRIQAVVGRHLLSFGLRVVLAHSHHLGHHQHLRIAHGSTQ